MWRYMILTITRLASLLLLSYHSLLLTRLALILCVLAPLQFVHGFLDLTQCNPTYTC